MGSRRYQSPCNVLLESYILSWFGLNIQTWLKTIRYVHRPFRVLFSTVCTSQQSLVTCNYVWAQAMTQVISDKFPPFPINKKS